VCDQLGVPSGEAAMSIGMGSRWSTRQLTTNLHKRPALYDNRWGLFQALLLVTKRAIGFAFIIEVGFRNIRLLDCYLLGASLTRG
jgi:hypothetical protein